MPDSPIVLRHTLKGASGWRGRASESLPLLTCVIGSLGAYLALFLLLQSPSLRLTPTPLLQDWPLLAWLSDSLAPPFLKSVAWTTDHAALLEHAYLLVTLALAGLWGAALWFVWRRARAVRLGWLLAAILLLGVPLILLPVMTSDDLYLYIFYGRTIATYGQNPILVAPSQFPDDPLLGWVFWKELPSAYGPVWLLLAGGLSELAGDSLSANVFAHRAAALVIHLLTTVAVWSVWRKTRPELATWGAIFYGWNPLVLIEGIGNGHNDLVVGLFTALAFLAVTRARWLVAVALLVAAALVKTPAALLLPLLLLAWLRTVPPRQRPRVALSALVVAALSGLVMHAPLWAGSALLDNVLRNPAARDYGNSFWEPLALGLAPALPDAPNALSIARGILFAGLYAALARRLWRGRDPLEMMAWAWFAYYLCAGWIWPWYFLAVVPVAALQCPGRVTAMVAALSLGGLAYWVSWLEPTSPAPSMAPFFYQVRPALLFLPAILVAAWPVAAPERLRHALVRAARSPDRAPFTHGHHQGLAREED